MKTKNNEAIAMLRMLFMSIAVFAFAACTSPKVEVNIVDEGIKKAEAFGINLAIQSSTFSDYPLEEVFGKTQELGIKYIELTLGHRWQEKSFSASLSVEEQIEIAEYAKQCGVSIIGISINGTADGEEEWEHIFTLAQSLSAEYIVCSPPTKELDTIVKLAAQAQTNVKIAIRNDLEYATLSPEELLETIKEHPSHLLKICADVTVWQSQEIDYIDALTTLQGYIATTYIRDIESLKRNPSLIDTAWGSGSIDIDGILMNLKKQGYKGYLPIHIVMPNAEDAVKESISYYGLVCNYIF